MQLVHIMLGPLQGVADQHTLSLLVYLHHVQLGLLPVPAKHRLKNMRDVIHQIHRIIPTNDQVTGFQCLPVRRFLFLLNPWQRCLDNTVRHAIILSAHGRDGNHRKTNLPI